MPGIKFGMRAIEINKMIAQLNPLMNFARKFSSSVSNFGGLNNL
jgi:hypothetical protein